MSIPPTAAIIGSRACFIFESSPCRNSLLISNVTKKKKTAIKASFIQCNTDSFNPKLLIPINRYLFKVAKYKSAKVELLIIKATIAANNNTNPLAASSLKNHLKGFDSHQNIQNYIQKVALKNQGSMKTQ